MGCQPSNSGVNQAPSLPNYISGTKLLILTNIIYLITPEIKINKEKFTLSKEDGTRKKGQCRAEFLYSVI